MTSTYSLLWWIVTAGVIALLVWDWCRLTKGARPNGRLLGRNGMPVAPFSGSSSTGAGDGLSPGGHGSADGGGHCS